MICHHQLPRIACVYCLHSEVEQLRAERQQLRIAIYNALAAMEAQRFRRRVEIIQESTAFFLCGSAAGLLLGLLLLIGSGGDL